MAEKRTLILLQQDFVTRSKFQTGFIVRERVLPYVVPVTSYSNLPFFYSEVDSVE